MPNWLPILRRRGVPVLFYSLINQGYKDEYYQELLGVSRGARNHQYVDGWVVIDTEDSDAFMVQFGPRLEQETYTEFFLSQCQLVADELFELGASLRANDFRGAVDSELLFAFMRFVSRTVRVMPFLNTMVSVQDAVENRLRSALAESWSLQEDDPQLAAGLQAAMVSAQEPLLASQSINELEAIARGILHSYPQLADLLKSTPTEVEPSTVRAYSDKLHDRLREYLNRFDFLSTDYYVGDPTSWNELVEQLGALISRKRSAASPEDASASRGIPEKLQGQIRQARKLQFLRQYRLEALFKSGRDARALFEATANRLGASYNEFVNLTFGEVQESLSAQQLMPGLDVVHRRMAEYASYVEDGIPRIITGQELKALKEMLPPDKVSPAEVLTGTTAYPGQREGVIRIIDRLDNIAAFNPGEILVAPMTLPYHVAAMMIASAVVTDEGGILSHAAIVCRELKIPCVVGVQTATSQLRSGDVVRVDASPSLGRITLLKPSSES